MNGGFTVSYETIGASSYMTVLCPADVELVQYQLGMLLSNDIKNLLAVSRQVLDGETVLYYNITSRVPLGQILEKRPLKRKELLCLIEGAIGAIKDASDYRLPAEGILLEADHIYVDPATCGPAFVYLPAPGGQSAGLKGLITGLVVDDKIEMSNDNLIQVLLRELNRQPFSVDQLEKSLKPYQTTGTGVYKNEAPAGAPRSMGQPTTYQQPVGMPSIGTQPINRQPAEQQMTSIQDQAGGHPDYRRPAVATSMYQQSDPSRGPVAEEGQRAGDPPLPVPEKPIRKKKKAERIDTTDKDSIADEENRFDPEKAKRIFLLPQALLMVVTAASISFGLFVDEAGGLVINNILAFVIVILLAEVILYREAYVNPKKEQNSSKKKTKGKKTGRPGQTVQPKAKPSIPTAPRPGIRPEPSGGFSANAGQAPRPDLRPEIQPRPQQEIQPRPQQEIRLEPMQGQSAPMSMGSHPVDTPQRTGYPFLQDAEDTEGIEGTEGETELLDGGPGGDMPAYLEYYENGRLTRVPIGTGNGVIVGRLQTEVDLAIKNPKVGKIHARFFCQGGQYFVVDINSKNGTYINGNGMRIESNLPHLLHDKDRIMLADSELVIRCAEI